MGTATCVDIILAIILPPLGVFLKFGCKVCLSCENLKTMSIGPGGFLTVDSSSSVLAFDVFWRESLVYL
ncbi:hypothetical protein HHK36_033446 [Tetracentron sinense]|uniref:Uncharacterized protein n=1 Tax=Tetracentron sinense TaxID=13715 RepID=A0A834Y7J6_TETSI|nr:hypothetical protein HHK36_033446 [Tetracentron sinense]